MGIYRDRVLPRVIDKACGSPELATWRASVSAGLQGRVVEIGFGSGLNLPHFPPEVEVVLAVEPAELARRLAAPRIAAAPFPVEHVGLDGQRLELDDASCDAAVCTFTLCTVPDPAAALAELRRVVRPGGTIHLLEHGLADDTGVRTWQHRLDPIQRRIADGCHLTRRPVELVEAAGFRFRWHESRYARGPKPWSWFTAGVADRPA